MPHRATALLIALAALLAVPASAGAQAGVSYLIPPGNPFANAAGAAPEVWILGLRNPFRFSFGPAGQLVIGDVGASSREEIDVVPPGQSGLNLGWPCREGTATGPQSLTPGCQAGGFTDPVFDYPSVSGAVIGGYVVRDPALTGLVGRYLYADLAVGDIRSIELNGSGDDSTDAMVGAQGPSTFGEDAQRRLYVANVGTGRVFRLGSAGAGALNTTEIDDVSAPTYVTAPPGDGSRLVITEQGGVAWMLVNDQRQDEPFLDLSSQTTTTSERGLQSIAFAPDYSESGKLYAFYTDTEGDLRVDEFRRSANPNRVDPASQRSVLTVEHSSAANHNGGQLQFGPDGYLYISTGDGGNQGDAELDGQNRGSLLGKILRIDPDPADPGPSTPPDTTAPSLQTRVPKRQRVLRRGGAIAYATCSEACRVSMSGRLRVGRRSFKLRRAGKSADAGKRLRLRARLKPRSRRALRRVLRRWRRQGLRRARRPKVRVALRARDAAGNRSALVRRTVRVRRR